MNTESGNRTSIESSREKEKKAGLLNVLVQKLYSIGIVLSDLIGDSQLINNHVVKTPPVRILDEDISVSFKSREWIEPNSELIVFQDQNKKEYSFLIKAVVPIANQETEDWKTYGRLPGNFEVSINLGKEAVYLDIKRDSVGKIAVNMLTQSDLNTVQLILNMLEAVDTLFNTSFQTMPLAKNEQQNERELKDFENIFPDGGIIINPKYAV